MNDTQQDTKPESRSYTDIADEFDPVISSLKATNDLLSQAIDLVSLDDNTVRVLAWRCYEEAETVKALFKELYDKAKEAES